MLYETKNTSNQKAFTLIELLVTIGIIGVLSAIVLLGLNAARLRSRDAARIAEVKNLHTALESYWNDNAIMPSCSDVGYAGGCDAADGLGTGLAADSSLDGQFSDFLVAGGFLGSAPLDPVNQGNSYYAVFTNVEFPASSGNYYAFMVGAALENFSDPALSASLTAGDPSLGHLFLLGTRDE